MRYPTSVAFFLIFSLASCSSDNVPSDGFENVDAVEQYNIEQGEGFVSYQRSLYEDDPDISVSESSRLLAIDMAKRACDCLERFDMNFILENPNYLFDESVEEGSSEHKRLLALAALNPVCTEMADIGNIRFTDASGKRQSKGLSSVGMDTYPAALDSLCPERVAKFAKFQEGVKQQLRERFGQ